MLGCGLAGATRAGGESGYELPGGLWCLLHRTFDFITDPWYA